MIQRHGVVVALFCLVAVEGCASPSGESSTSSSSAATSTTTAAKVSFDPSQSDGVLTGTNVQTAIDQLAARALVAGPKGPTGAMGPTGPAGTTGATGAAGAHGPTGASGLPGPEGPTGTQGPTGPQGTPGAAGTPGASGPTGPQGQAGPSGVLALATGETTTTFTSSTLASWVSTGTSVSFTLSAAATVVVEFGGYLHAQASTVGSEVQTIVQPGVDGALPVSGDRRAALNAYSGGSVASTGEASAMNIETLSLAAGTHTLVLYGEATHIYGQDMPPWLMVTAR